ncbi:MAG: polysaccharide deacetylase family protein, partial [Bacteroidota bacterium]
MLKFGVINFLFAALLLALLVFDYAVNVSIWWYVVLMLMYSLIQAYGSAVLSAQFFVPVKYKGSSTSQAIAITFDDGPISGKTEKILDILKAHDIKAAFFCVGYRIHDNPQLVQRIHAEGHIVANHSYWHSKTFDLQWGSKIADEL